MNSIVLDLTSNKHYVAIFYEQEKYFFSFEEESLEKRNDWEHKISVINENIPGFEFKQIEKMAYAAGPGSYTGARLAFTFLDTLGLILNKKFYAFSNLTALKHRHPERVAIIKGSKNDFFYRYEESDHHCMSLDEIPQGRAYIAVESDRLKQKDLLEISREDISKNILDLVLEFEDKALPSNYPNYIKELKYTKSR